MGSFSVAEIDKFYSPNLQLIERMLSYGIGFFPEKLANFIMTLYFILWPKNSWRHMYDLLHSSKSMVFTRFLARVMNIKEAKK